MRWPKCSSGADCRALPAQPQTRKNPLPQGPAVLQPHHTCLQESGKLQPLSFYVLRQDQNGLHLMGLEGIWGLAPTKQSFYPCTYCVPGPTAQALSDCTLGTACGVAVAVPIPWVKRRRFPGDTSTVSKAAQPGRLTMMPQGSWHQPALISLHGLDPPEPPRSPPHRRL